MGLWDLPRAKPEEISEESVWDRCGVIEEESILERCEAIEEDSILDRCGC